MAGEDVILNDQNVIDYQHEVQSTSALSALVCKLLQLHDVKSS